MQKYDEYMNLQSIFMKINIFKIPKERWSMRLNTVQLSKINITDAEGEWLFNIGRFNRPSGVKSEEFFINTMGL